MATYLLRRLLLMVPTLVGITVVVFAVMAIQPGGVGGTMLAEKAGGARGADAAKVRAYYEERYGLDAPPPVQYLRWLNRVSPVGFETWDQADPQVVAAKAAETSGRAAKERDLAATGVPADRAADQAKRLVSVGPHAGEVRLDRPTLKAPSLGDSMSQRRPVTDLMAEALPVTLLLELLSVPLVYVTGILSGVRAARSRGSLFDAGFGAVQLATWSLPVVWVGVLLIGLLANVEYLKWFPTAGLVEPDAGAMPFLPSTGPDGAWRRGWLLDVCWHLALPVFCLTFGGSAFIAKLVRGSVLENLAADYARTARAKGLAEGAVIYRHVFRNSTLALITVAAAILPAMIAGSVIVETIFSIPGMGRLGVSGARFGDREVVLGVTLVGGVLSLVSALLRDVMYAVADPRVTYD
jgi:microcin C transport system permease protein